MIKIVLALALLSGAAAQEAPTVAKLQELQKVVDFAMIAKGKEAIKHEKNPAERKEAAEVSRHLANSDICEAPGDYTGDAIYTATDDADPEMTCDDVVSILMSMGTDPEGNAYVPSECSTEDMAYGSAETSTGQSQKETTQVCCNHVKSISSCA